MALQVGRAQDEHCSAHLAMQMEREGKGKPCSSTGEGEARELDGGGDRLGGGGKTQMCE